MAVVVGVDGCKAGWFVVFADTEPGRPLTWKCVERFDDILNDPASPSIIAIDVPIGLLSAAQRGGRPCDRVARELLGKRRNSVFSPPVRAVLNWADDYRAACNANRSSSPEGISISKQCFNIIPKIAEVDQAMTPSVQDRVKEVLPELSFWKMGGNNPTRFPKKKTNGKIERIRLLEENGFWGITAAFAEHPRSAVQIDDMLDAAAACWTAIRIIYHNADRIPEGDDRDEKDLRMEMWV